MICSFCRRHAVEAEVSAAVCICGECIADSHELIAGHARPARQQPFACSFCGTHDAAHLVLGPRHFICDRCIQARVAS